MSTEELSEEWDLAEAIYRVARWLPADSDKRVALRESLKKHLGSDAFVVQLVETAISYSHDSNGNSEKRLAWDMLFESFGEGLAGAVNRVANSADTNRSIDLQDTITLAQRYASGWRPKNFMDSA